jgi:hypothetical protein
VPKIYKELERQLKAKKSTWSPEKAIAIVSSKSQYQHLSQKLNNQEFIYK